LRIESTEAPARRNSQFSILDSRFLPYAVFLTLAILSWNSWIEPYVDTGRELMVPRRVAAGERLYRDVQFHHGPLAPYLGAALDRLSGASLSARTGFAVLLAALHVALLIALGRRFLSRPRAALAASVAVASAVFLRPGGWLFPFSFDLAIAVTALTGALLFATREPPSDAAAGGCAFVALLARPDLALPAIVLIALAAARTPRRLIPLATLPAGGAAIVYLAVSAGIPLSTLAARGWLSMVHPPAAFRKVYLAYSGLDRIGLRLAELLLAAILLALLGAFLVLAAFVGGRGDRYRRPGVRTAVLVAATASLVAVAVLRFRPPARFAPTAELLPPLVRVVPLAVVCAAAVRVLVRLRRRAPSGPLAAVPDAVLWVAALFAARLLLAAGYVGPYDAFFLPLPLLVAAAALYGIAESAAPAVGPALPALCSAALAVFLLFRIAATAAVYRSGAWTRVETPAGRLRLPEPEASTTRAALEDLRRRLPPGSTLIGLPEGGFFDYVLRLRNPLPFEQFFPGRLDEEAERRLALAIAERPADAVLYANVLAVGEGARILGEDYLVRLDRAIRSATTTAATYGPGARSLARGGTGARAGARIGDPGFFVEIRVPKESAR
jgi:hypothetical protein